MIGIRSLNSSSRGPLPASVTQRRAWAHPDDTKLKICVLAACPFPANHGTPGSIREMAEAVAERGHEVHIVTYHIGDDIPIHGPIIHRIPRLTNESAVVVGPTVRRPLYDLQMVFKALAVIRDHKPNLIHAHGYEAALVAGLCRLVTGLPVVYSGHNTMSDELPSYGFFRPKWVAVAIAKILDGIVPRIGTRCLPHSANIEKFFHRMGLRRKTEPVVNFGINLDWVGRGDGSAIRQRYGLDQHPVIVYAGVLDEFQRLDLLLEAMAKIAQRDRHARLLIVMTIAKPKSILAIQQMARELGIADRVVLTEQQSLESVRDCLAAGDVAVVPRPQAPGFPIKLLNYMASRKPCVLFASSASRGLINRENSLLVAPDTNEALADGIFELLHNQELRLRLGRNGYQFVRSYHDRRLIAQQICATYYRTLVADNRLPPAYRMPIIASPDSPFQSQQESERSLDVMDLREIRSSEVLCDASA